ncbi:MAG: hypothetical protein ACKV2T_06065 [Kofleriaceae bacterium]
MWPKLLGLAILGLAIAGVVWLVRGSSSLPDEVQPIEWNRQACSHCQMLIGEPRHAAQLITKHGEVHAFDDPGCAIRFIARHDPELHRLWFHHGTAERWVSSDQATFVTNGMTPMGSGLVVVDPGAPGGIDFSAARRVALDGGVQ